MRLVCISDTHTMHNSLEMPEGDVLVHCGDATYNGTEPELRKFVAWLKEQPYKRKIFVPGNHDLMFQDKLEEAMGLMDGAADVLLDSGLEIEGKRFWGSPWVPWCGKWAFSVQSRKFRAKKWALIPEGTDVLITHGPPLGRGDKVLSGENVGCERMRAYSDKAPLHLFGHIHEGYGVGFQGKWANVSSCNVRYSCVNPPVIFDI